MTGNRNKSNLLHNFMTVVFLLINRLAVCCSCSTEFLTCTYADLKDNLWTFCVDGAKWQFKQLKIHVIQGEAVNICQWLFSVIIILNIVKSE